MPFGKVLSPSFRTAMSILGVLFWVKEESVCAWGGYLAEGDDVKYSLPLPWFLAVSMLTPWLLYYGFFIGPCVLYIVFTTN